MKQKNYLFLVDVGVLLSEKDDEFSSYNQVYDKKHGFYDEDQYYSADKNLAIEQVKQYVAQGVENSYGVVSISDTENTNQDIANLNVSGETYDAASVVYSVAKIDGTLVEHFVATK